MAPGKNPKKKPLMRNIGEFVGHVAKSIKSDPAPPGAGPSVPADAGPEAAGADPADQPKLVRKTVQQHEVHTPRGKVVLRRTIIDEVDPPQG